MFNPHANKTRVRSEDTWRHRQKNRPIHLRQQRRPLCIYSDGSGEEGAAGNLFLRRIQIDGYLRGRILRGECPLAPPPSADDSDNGLLARIKIPGKPPPGAKIAEAGLAFLDFVLRFKMIFPLHSAELVILRIVLDV